MLRASGDTRAALERIERTLRIAPHFCDAHLEHLSLRLELGEVEGAREVLDVLHDACRTEQEVLTSAAALMQEDAGGESKPEAAR